MKNKIFILTILFSFLFCGICFATAIIRVPLHFSTIQDAIDFAHDGDIIKVSPGIYQEHIDFDGKNITLESTQGPESTIIQGSVSEDPLVKFASGEGLWSDYDAIFKGFTLRNNTNTYEFDSYDRYHDGGAILCCSNSEPKIINCIITGNSAERGGGICIYGGSEPVIKNVIIAENYADKGGGIYIANAQQEYLYIKNATIVNNTALNSGGIYFLNSYTRGLIVNSIIWDNMTSDGIIVNFNASDFDYQYCCLQHNMSGEGNIIKDNPLLDENYVPKCFSPCVDAGHGSHTLETDIYGSSRFNDLYVPDTGGGSSWELDFTDIGAVERQENSYTLNVPDPYPTIQDAIDVAWDGAIIIVGPGQYGEINLGGKRLIIQSTDGADYTIIDAGGSGDVVNAEQPDEKIEYIDTVIEGFTIRNGNRGIVCSGLDRKIINNDIIDGFVEGGIHGTTSTCEITNNIITNNGTIHTPSGGIYLLDSAAIIENNTIQVNNTSLSGGGIYISEGLPTDSRGLPPLIKKSVTVENNTISENNSNALGGGVCLIGTPSSPRNFSVDLNNNTITDNTSADSGGGLYLTEVSMEADNNIISNNQADGPFGGGIYLADSTATITDSTIDNNSSVDSGGGLYLVNADVESTNNTITNNSTSQKGGGLYLDQTNLVSTNSLITDNTATYGGGAFFTGPGAATGHTVDLINNTIAGNNATSGGGLYLEDFYYLPNITNTVIWGNGESESIKLLFGAHPVVRYSDIKIDTGVWEGEDNINADPLFEDQATGNYSLGSFSPCIDRADADEAPTLWTTIITNDSMIRICLIIMVA